MAGRLHDLLEAGDTGRSSSVLHADQCCSRLIAEIAPDLLSELERVLRQ
jgi:hypothetical protein